MRSLARSGGEELVEAGHEVERDGDGHGDPILIAAVRRIQLETEPDGAITCAVRP